ETAPPLSAMRLRDAGGHPAWSVAPGSAPRLSFSAADYKFKGPLQYDYAGHRTSATKVWYRVEGAGDWRPLMPVISGEQSTFTSLADPPRGVTYDVDLAEVTRSPGLIDLRV